jgi:hypothetical protein
MTAMPRAFISRFIILLALVVFAVFRLPVTVHADVRSCDCQLGNPEAMSQKRECSLCLEADKYPAYVPVLFLKDKNPTKPNRLLALPRKHGPGGQPLSSLKKEERIILWSAAVSRAQELWGNDWGIAYNGDERRTQCHTHLHIGKLLSDQEHGKAIAVDSISKIPAPTDGTGLWVHPLNGKLHVHLGEQVNEFVLMR